MSLPIGQYVTTPRGLGVVVNSEPHDIWHQVMRARVTAAPINGCACFPIHGTVRYLCFDVITMQHPDVHPVEQGESDATLADLRADVQIQAKLFREDCRVERNAADTDPKALLAAVDALYDYLDTLAPREAQPVT